MLRPSEYDLKTLAFAIDYETLPRFREHKGDEGKDGQRKTFRGGFLQAVENNRRVTAVMVFDGELTTPGVQSKSFDRGDVDSLGLRLIDHADVERMEAIWQLVMPASDAESEHWQLLPLFKGPGGDTLYFKLKRKYGQDDVYACKSNVPLQPGDNNAAGLEVAQPIKVVAQVSAYYSVDDEIPTCGVYFTVKEVLVGETVDKMDVGTQTVADPPTPAPAPARVSARGRKMGTTK